ncbi:MAG: DNA polymerase III subunit gamma/tau [Magnetococcales bacterium]|nr:DNA polymerase III subunit gamma/tau [Magnetococcales bacterium]
MPSYVVLARKWRPRSFQALVGQDHVTRSLKNALESGRIPHAFLFTGIRGVGKTTLARLLAMCLNCEEKTTPDPCGECSSCQEIISGRSPDVQEIDAASRTKVDQMREVLDTVCYAPSASRFKVYILDEVHMLSTQSFNALLKTLEEPPHHVKFIFATTESRKIPATILSRCQRYDLKRVPREVLTGHMTRILEAEKVAFDPPGLAAVVRAADGSVRDGLSVLDQVIAHGEGSVHYETVKHLLGLTDREGVLTLLADLLNAKGPEILAAARQFHEGGVEPKTLVNELLDGIHQGVREKVRPSSPELLEQDPQLNRIAQITGSASQERLQMIYQVLLRGQDDLRMANDPQQALEMLLIRVAYLKPVPDLDRLIRSLGPSPGGGRAGGQGGSHPTSSDSSSGGAPGGSSSSTPSAGSSGNTSIQGALQTGNEAGENATNRPPSQAEEKKKSPTPHANSGRTATKSPPLPASTSPRKERSQNVLHPTPPHPSNEASDRKKPADISGDQADLNPARSPATHPFSPPRPPPDQGALQGDAAGALQKKNVRDLTSWEQLLSFAGQKAPLLALKLKQQVACLGFKTGDQDSKGYLELQLTQECFGPPARLEKTLGEFLTEHECEVFQISVRPASNQPRPETVQEGVDRQKREYTSQLEQEVLAHPAARLLTSHFQARLSGVEPLDDLGLQQI